MVLVVFSVLLIGCGWFGSKHAAPLKKAEFIKTEQIVDAHRLKKGGKVLIIPFSAGVGVEATNDLDRGALMIVKGIADVLKEEGSFFKILDSNNAQDADFIIKGHFVGLREKTDATLLFFKKQKIYYADVEGKISDPKSGETLLVFADSKKTEGENETLKDLGYAIGLDIGHFILSSIQ